MADTQAELDYVQAFGDMMRASAAREEARARTLDAAKRVRAESGKPTSTARTAELVDRAITDSGLDENTPQVRAARMAVLLTQQSEGGAPLEF